MSVEGRFVGSSNATLLVTCELDGTEVRAVYKPERGERRLWDFPSGLHRREMAAHLLSEVLGWGLVPVTVIRDTAPFGRGSVQHFVEDDGESHYFTLREDPAHLPALKKIATLDLLLNNADRKSGHVILAGGRIWAIDHGLCFHHHTKLRTVMWDFAGEEIPRRYLADIGRALDRFPDALGDLLSERELAALVERAEKVLASGEFPLPEDRDGWPPYPWPLV